MTRTLWSRRPTTIKQTPAKTNKTHIFGGETGGHHQFHDSSRLIYFLGRGKAHTNTKQLSLSLTRSFTSLALTVFIGSLRLIIIIDD